jgi:large subunit ribosomal protein L3
MIGLIGKKLGMTRRFLEDGRSVPVTVIQAGPCVVTQVKNTRTDGYCAVQVGFGSKKPKNTPMPMQGHFRKASTEPLRTVCEYRFESEPAYKLGDRIDLSVLEGAAKVDVVGTTKGHGFAGTIKRWGHHRGPASHGSKNTRESGGIGMCEFPGRVLKGKQMAGHFGNKQETKKNLHIVAIDKERNLLLVRGSIPGHRNGIVFIRPSR